MSKDRRQDLEGLLIQLVPHDGTALGNERLRERLGDALGREVTKVEYFQARDALIELGVIAKGAGRGGSVHRLQKAPDELVLRARDVRDDLGSPARARQPRGPRTSPAIKVDAAVISYRHSDRRKNNPEVGMVDPDSDPDAGKSKYAYDPHIDPQLQFDVGHAKVESLIDDALASGDRDRMQDALLELKRMAGPYLNWAGKAERTSFEIDTVSLHVHERIDPATILRAVRGRLMDQSGEGASQQDWLRAWFETPLPYREAIEFYRHDRGWSNRLIAGDSMLVMNSLLQKESMAGQVQMIYIDPPYGIKYGSNFQPFVNKRLVQDRKDEDLTQEPEMIKAFRDTWELGIHSYLAYLRDRLLLARELLSPTGSVFVQISDENAHRARLLLDEVFGPEQFVAQIAVKTTGGLTQSVMPMVVDYLLWYARDVSRVKSHQLFSRKPFGGDSDYQFVSLKSGNRRRLTSEERDDPYAVEGCAGVFQTTSLESENSTFHAKFFGDQYTQKWKTNALGLSRLMRANRLWKAATKLRYVRFVEDFPALPITNVWDDTVSSGYREQKTYVVQTVEKTIERCLLLCTDPGDLVLDPTCGSGTTAYVAEKWGRRWITCDTSRVAITLAKQRLLTASYDYYELKYPHEGLRGGFIYKTIPHVTLKSIANNPEIDEVWERMHPAVVQALANLNAVLREHPPKDTFSVTEGGRKGETVDFSAPASKAVKLPSGEAAPAGALLEWEVPFAYPEDWPEVAKPAFDDFHAARRAMHAKMDASIAAHADSEVLYDQPEISKTKRRVTGPFTFEAVPSPTVLSLDDELPLQEADAAIARAGASSRHHQWRDELAKTGIRGKGGQVLKFAELETLPDTRWLHCSGTILDTGERAVVSFGPEHAALEQRQVELAMREAGDLFPRPKMIIFCAFMFDPEAAKDIDAVRGITALRAQMNTDLLTEDLKKARASNQSFWLMGQPDVDLRQHKDDRWVVEVNGFDYFDTVKGELVSGGKGKIAAWMLDTDYDERSLFPRQVFFPMAGTRDGWNKLRRDVKAELDERLLATLHSTVSLPFEAGENRKIAVKIVDDRGIESIKVLRLP